LRCIYGRGRGVLGVRCILEEVYRCKGVFEIRCITPFKRCIHLRCKTPMYNTRVNPNPWVGFRVFNPWVTALVFSTFYLDLPCTICMHGPELIIVPEVDIRIFLHSRTSFLDYSIMHAYSLHV
jgi:hypothetical protein